jgi:SAM-dependent methyltransferase
VIEYYTGLGVKRIAPDFEFKEPVNVCPACESEDIIVDYLVSGTGIMSVAGFAHSRCRTCGTLFVNPEPTKKTLDAFYNSVEDENQCTAEAAIYSNTNANNTIPINRYRIELFEKLLSPGATILDVGCGCGVFVRLMKDRGFDIKGIDTSPNAIRVGSETLGLGNELSVCDWQDLKEGHYDAVTLWAVIEHLSNPGQFIEKARDITSPGAKLWLQFPTVDSLMYKFFELRFSWIMPPYHLTLFSKAGMESLLNRFNFNIVATYGIPTGFWSDVIARSAGLDDAESKVVSQLWKNGRTFLEAIDATFDTIAINYNAGSNVVFVCERV